MRALIISIAAMATVIALSNFAVQFPVDLALPSPWAGAEPIALAEWLTWGAFTYPIAFLVTDLTNRALGPQDARRVV